MSRTAVITGASDGIGLESASQLAGRGYDVVLVGRNPAKVDAAVTRIRAESPAVQVDSYVCDFASLANVRSLGASLLASYPRIEVLLNNAGTVFDKRTLTVDGFESTFAVNHLAGMQLTETLLPRLIESAPARIVTTASVGHYRGSMNFDDLGYERGYHILKAYGRSKLANVLYTRDLAERLAGTGVTATCFHPGTVATSIWHRGQKWVSTLVNLVQSRIMTTPAHGGERLTFLADDASVAGATGGYYEKNRLKEPSAIARDDAVRARLMEVSREMLGLSTSRGTA